MTGGTGNLGRAVTARFLRDGYRVAVSYAHDAEWDALRTAEEGAYRSGALLGFQADVTREPSIGTAIDDAARSFDGLRVLLHLAGGYRGGEPVEASVEDHVRGMVELNLVSAFWAAKRAIPHVKRDGQGRLLFVSSRGAVECYPGAAAYAASKLGLHALAQTLARELRGDGATANVVLPSVIDTPPNRAAMPDADFSRWVRPEQIAGTLAYLASGEAGAVSAALVPIYGRA